MDHLGDSIWRCVLTSKALPINDYTQINSLVLQWSPLRPAGVSSKGFVRRRGTPAWASSELSQEIAILTVCQPEPLIISEASLFYITFTCYHWLPLFQLCQAYDCSRQLSEILQDQFILDFISIFSIQDNLNDKMDCGAFVFYFSHFANVYLFCNSIKYTLSDLIYPSKVIRNQI